jgi:hypothetical protein
LRPGNLFDLFFVRLQPERRRRRFLFALCLMLRAGGLMVGGPLISRSLTIHDAAEPAELR